jgi:hypothetical protein
VNPRLFSNGLIPLTYGADSFGGYGTLPPEDIIFQTHVQRPSISLNSALAASTLLNGIISYWTLDEKTGSAIDAAGGGNNGTPTSVIQGAAGKINTAYAFNGSTSKLDMGSSANLALTTGSVSCWIYMPSLPAIDGIIFEKGDMSNQLYGYGMYYSSGRLVFETANASKHTNYYANTGVTLQAGVWYHVVCTWNGTTVVTYLNGVQRLSASQVTPCVFNNHDFGLGKNLPSNTAGFPGTIDEVGVWNRVLTSSEVASLYNTGTGFQYPFTATITTVSWAPSIPMVTNEITTLVTAYPNPYSSIVHFNLKTSVAGRGSLVIYDVLGRKVAIVFEGDLPAGDDRSIQYNLGAIPRQPLIYIFTIGDQVIHGKLIPGIYQQKMKD